jgi:hypothetical protein
MLAMMKSPRRTPTTMPMVVFVLEVVSRLLKSTHLVRCDKLDFGEIVSGAEAARAAGDRAEEVSGREWSRIYIQCLVLMIYFMLKHFAERLV